MVVIDTLFTKHNPNVKGYAIDVENAKKVALVFKKEKPDFVFHLAGPINLRKLIGDPLFLKDMHFLSRTKIILDACKKNNVKKIVFVSSGGAIYEHARIIPTKENYPAHPSSLYGLANLMIEKYIELYSKNNSLNFTIARLGNAYGPGQWGSGFIPATIIKMLKKEKSIMYGKGDQTRDFIYIDDAVEALMILAKKGSNEIYNVASGKETSLNDVFALLKNLLGVYVKPLYKNPHHPETPKSALDIQKIKKEYGWRSTTDLTAGLLKTIEWFKKK